MDVLLGTMREKIIREQSFLIPLLRVSKCCVVWHSPTYILPASKEQRESWKLGLEQCQQSSSVEQMASFQVLIDMIYWHSSFKMGPLITRYKSRPIITPLLGPIGVIVITPVTYLSKTALLQGSHFTIFHPIFHNSGGRSWRNFTHQVAQGILRVCDDDEIGTCTTLGRKQCINS